MNSFSTVILPLLLLLPTINAQANFKCGRNDVESFFASLSVTLNCQPKLAQFNNCCVAHDKCYDNQLGRTKCDNVFCNCLAVAAADNLFCKVSFELN